MVSSSQHLDPLYESLNKAEDKIRLLSILPSLSWDATVECQLSKHSLKRIPQFTAFSYVWGDAFVTHKIVLNGRHKAVRTNLVELCNMLELPCFPRPQRHISKLMLFAYILRC